MASLVQVALDTTLVPELPDHHLFEARASSAEDVPTKGDLVIEQHLSLCTKKEREEILATLDADLAASKADAESGKFMYKQYEHTTNLVFEDKTGESIHQFLRGVYYAYSQHLPLQIRVEDIQVCINLAINTCINNNPEKFRSRLVDHQGQKELCIHAKTDDDLKSGKLFSSFVEMMDPRLPQYLKQDYSSSSAHQGHTASAMTISIMQTYYACKLVLGCGMREVHLSKNLDDWKKLLDRIQYLAELFADTELGAWFGVQLYTLVTRLVDTVTKEVSPEMNNFWQRIVTHIPQGSGGDVVMSGWIHVLVPYSSNGKFITPLGSKMPINVLTLEPTPDFDSSFGAGQDEMMDWFQLDGENVQGGTTLAPLTIIDNDGHEYKRQIVAGFMSPTIDPEDNYVVRANHGWICRPVPFQLPSDDLIDD